MPEKIIQCSLCREIFPVTFQSKRRIEDLTNQKICRIEDLTNQKICRIEDLTNQKICRIEDLNQIYLKNKINECSECVEKIIMKEYKIFSKKVK